MKKILLIGTTLLLTACAVPHGSHYDTVYYPHQNAPRPYYSDGNYYNNNPRNYRSYDKHNNGKGYGKGKGYKEGHRGKGHDHDHD